MKLIFQALLCFLLIAARMASCDATHYVQTTAFTKQTLTIQQQKIVVEVAATKSLRELGLMRRTELANNAGMLFVFPEPQMVAMWMKDTLIPLSVAFLDAAGRIINIEDMEPHSLEPHYSRAPAQYALEMPLGWFTQTPRKIAPGQLVEGLKSVPRAKD